MAIGPIPLPITGQKIADTFGFIANGPASNLNSYRGAELRDARTNIIRFLPINGVIKYSDFENLYLPFSFPVPELSISGPSDRNAQEGDFVTLVATASIDWNLDQWPESAPLPTSYRRRARWQQSQNNGASWTQVQGFVSLNQANQTNLRLRAQLYGDGWLHRTEVLVEALDSLGQVITSARRFSRQSRFTVTETPLANPTVDFTSGYNNLRLTLQLDQGGALVQAASGEIRTFSNGFLTFNDVTDLEAPEARRPVSDPVFEWEWWARQSSSSTPQRIAGGLTNRSGAVLSGDTPGSATSFAGVSTIASGGLGGGLRGLRFNNLANSIYDNYEFQARLTIRQNISSPVQELSDSAQANWARLNVDQRVSGNPGATFNAVEREAAIIDTVTDDFRDNAEGPVLTLRTTGGIGKRVRIRILNESTPPGGLTRQFVGNFPQFGPRLPGLLRGSFEHTLYSDNDRVGFFTTSTRFGPNPGILRGLNRTLPTQEPARIEPVDPSEWAGWTGTDFNLVILNDVQKAESFRTTPQEIMEGDRVNIEVQASDVENDGATFRWQLIGFDIGSGPTDTFPFASGTFPVEWPGSPESFTSATGYIGTSGVTANPNPDGLTEGEIESKQNGDIRVLDQFNNAVGVHPVVVRRYKAPPPSLPPLPAAVNVNNSGQYRNVQIRMEPGGTAFLRLINPLNTAFNTSSTTRWNVGPTPSELRPELVWQVLDTDISVNVSNSGPQTGPFTSPSLWNTYSFTDNAPNGTALTVGVNMPNAINTQSNPNDILVDATFTIRVSLVSDSSVFETFTATASISAPIRTNPPGGGGAGDGALD